MAEGAVSAKAFSCQKVAADAPAWNAGVGRLLAGLESISKMKVEGNRATMGCRRHGHAFVHAFGHPFLLLLQQPLDGGLQVAALIHERRPDLGRGKPARTQTTSQTGFGMAWDRLRTLALILNLTEPSAALCRYRVGASHTTLKKKKVPLTGPETSPVTDSRHPSPHPWPTGRP